MSYNISKIFAREILDSRGNPTVEVDVSTKGGAYGRASVPSGASKGEFESVELRDGGTRYHGKGVLRAVSSVNEVIAPKLLGVDVRQQEFIDRTLIDLDGTANKSKLGSNALLGVSLACAKAASSSLGKPLFEYVGETEAGLLPMPFFNIVNGGKHAGNQLDFQEFMIVPNGAHNLGEAVRVGAEIYHQLKQQLLERYGKSAINVGDEGGFSPPINKPEEAIENIMQAIEDAGYEGDAKLAMDVAATTFYHSNKGYIVSGKAFSRPELVDLYHELVKTYPIVSIEDPLHEEDFEGFAEATRKLPIQILGDDIFVTNTKRLKKGIEMGAGNALLWKVNQVGTLTEALEAAELARKNGYAVQASHRSGETEDTFVADLSVAINCGQIKSGAPCRGERIAKYNRLIRIEEKLGDHARFPTGYFTK